MYLDLKYDEQTFNSQFENYSRDLLPEFLRPTDNEIFLPSLKMLGNYKFGFTELLLIETSYAEQLEDGLTELEEYLMKIFAITNELSFSSVTYDKNFPLFLLEIKENGNKQIFWAVRNCPSQSYFEIFCKTLFTLKGKIKFTTKYILIVRKNEDVKVERTFIYEYSWIWKEFGLDIHKLNKAELMFVLNQLLDRLFLDIPNDCKNQIFSFCLFYFVKVGKMMIMTMVMILSYAKSFPLKLPFTEL